jgi:soluble lytic murein transglycosylase-like protein
MRLAITIWLLLAVNLALPLQTKGAIYTFIDEAGSVHFTNVPDDPRYQPVNRSRARARIIPGDPLQYEEHIREAARRYEIDPLLIKAVIKAESNFDCRAVSRRGAKGLMQLMPETAKDLNVYDPFDPLANILGGTFYLRQLLERFDGNLKLVLAAYNAGPNKVETLGRIPRIPETQVYVRRVLWNYQKMTEESSPHKKWVGITY